MGSKSSNQKRDEEKCPKGIRFSRVNARRIQADFDGEDTISDRDLLLVKQVDRTLGLTSKLAKRLAGNREEGKILHDTKAMLRQCVYGGEGGASQYGSVGPQQ